MAEHYLLATSSPEAERSNDKISAEGKAGTMAVDSTPSSKETATVIDNPFEMDKIKR